VNDLAKRLLADMDARALRVLNKRANLFPPKFLPEPWYRIAWLFVTRQERTVNPEWARLQNQLIKFRRPNVG